MKVLHKTSLVSVITLIFSLSISSFNAIEAASFNIDLIHRDSLQSPSFNSSYEHVEAALQRSFNRVETLIQGHSPQSSTSVDVVPDTGEYLMRIAIGTPKVEILAIIDTGSDLTWIQCSPSGPWYRRKPPLFVAKRSSTYTPVSCYTNICRSIPLTSCKGTKGSCSYMVQYVDRSLSKGDVAVEKITLGKNVIDRVVIGCSHLSEGSFTPAMSGVVGLGGGRHSLIRQMGPSFGGKFSYCLVPQYLSSSGRQTTTKPSKIHFGDEAVVSGAGVATTPFVTQYSQTLYYMSLVEMSVGNQRLFDSEDSDNESSEKLQEGNMIIDSGCTLTFLPSKLYHQVEAAVRRQVIGLRQIDDPKKLLSLCYAATIDADKKIPEITMHFKGANVKLKSYNTFTMTSKKSMCLAFAPSNLSIFGNLAQMNFLIGYDLEKKTISFKPTSCSS